MLLCDCPSCGRRELRSVRAVFAHRGTFAIRCRRCGTLTLASGARVKGRSSRADAVPAA